MMYAYHRLWLSLLVLAILTTNMCGFVSEHDVSENGNLKHKSHLGTAHVASSMKDSELSEDLPLELHHSLRFEPSLLDFGTWSVGTVRSHTVTLLNQNHNRSVYLSSVSCGTQVFSSSFFEANMVPPSGNTTFNVIFLPQEQGYISTSLHIHTSFGKFQLMVRGEGRECPYRLKPLLGIRAPLNATLMPEIHMYNPHQKALQVLEVYSSGGHFQLELPSRDSEAPKDLWEIPPFTTKPIIRIRFQGYTAGNYSAFIRIKIAEPFNANKNEEQVLVLPVGFEILPKYGVYAVNPLLEFGHIAVDTSEMKIFKQKLYLKHSKSQLEMNDFEFKSMTYLNGVMVENNTTIVLRANEVEANEVVHLNEKLELVLKDKTAYTYHIDLLIRADIYKGNLHYDVNNTFFWINSHDYKSNRIEDVEMSDALDNRLLRLRNDFEIPLAIYNITRTRNDWNKLSLQLPSFETGIVLSPGRSIDLFLATELAKEHQEEHEQHVLVQDLRDLSNYKTVVYVYTNITNFEIPIVISSARLFVTTQTQTIWRYNTSFYTKELHLDSLLLREISSPGFIILQNRNSIPIKLVDFKIEKFQGIYYHLFYMGCIKADDLKENSDNSMDLEKANYKLTSKLEEGDVAVYKVNIQSYVTEQSTVYFKLSTQYENVTVDIKFTTVLGILEVDQEKLHFTNCFPGKLCSSELSIRSTFKHPIYVKYINFTNPGLRFKDNSRTGSKIAPETVTTIGRVFFEPSVLCGSRCYIQKTDELTLFPSTNLPDVINLSFDSYLPNFDEVELRRRIELYRHFKNYFKNIDFTMTTKDMQYFQLNLMIELEWPQLVNGRQVVPTIEVNKSHIHEVKISNPSDDPILIDYILSDPFYAPYTRISLPLEVVSMTPGCYLTDKSVFSLVNAAPKKPFLIPGLSSVTIPIKFQADYVGTKCTLLHIRNNLTLYEGVWISAKALQSQFRFGNRKPGSPTPLLFEITEQHLASSCPVRNKRIEENEIEHYIQPQVISRRVFTARNSGELPIRIDGFWIGNQHCKGYGFQVTDCTSFELKANTSKKIEISYQSDFTVTRISIPLTLKTNLTYKVSYILLAQLPVKGFEQCIHLLPRPPWELKIHNAAIVMLLVTFILVLIAVHIDYGNIIYNQSVLYEAREKGIVHPTFNLRNIAMRSTLQKNTENVSQTSGASSKSGKLKVSTVEKTDNVSAMMNLKKRNIKNTKAANSESKSMALSGQKTMSLAEMVSWTFGTKNDKKSSANNNKNVKSTGTLDQPNNTTATQATNNEKTTKSRFTEKSLLDKLDSDLKKSQTYKKAKVSEKTCNKNSEKLEEDVKIKREEIVDKEQKKQKSSPKLQNKSANSVESNSSFKGTKEERKALDLASQEVGYFQSGAATTTDKNQNSPKGTSNGQKIGKTPGRERRKQSAQSSSPTISEVTSSSCSSSTSSCSSNHYTICKRHERKSKSKASNSLKFFDNVTNTSKIFPTFSSSSSPTSLTTKIVKMESSKSHMDILSPWDSSNHISFSDVLQKPKAQPRVHSKLQQTTTNSTVDLNQKESLFCNLLSHSHATSLENSEIATALTPKRPKQTGSDLGPIGSKKSPSSTPVWEPLQSAITVEFPRPLNKTSTTATTSSSSSSFYPIDSNFGYNDITTISTRIPSTLQQQQDIHSQLFVLQQQLLEQRQQQFLNSNTLNNNWSSPLWGPILNNSSTAHRNNSSIYTQTPTPNSAWTLTPTSTSTSPGLVRPPPGLEQNFSLTTGMDNSRTLAASTTGTTTSSSTFNNTMASSTNINNDNMPMFNLFSGLSSIWNDNWKQSTKQQQSQSQQPASSNPQ